MNNVVVLKGLPDRMILRILPKEVSNTEFAYANTRTVILIPMEENVTFVAFDDKDEWNYRANIGTEELFGLMSGTGE
jgi:hypothetical protein